MIQFFRPDGKPDRWGGESNYRNEQLAKDARLNGTAWRLYAAAKSRTNMTGHAEFAPKELTEILGVDRSTVSRSIKTLRTVGVLHRESTAGCLWVSTDYFQRGSGSKARRNECPVHRTYRAWSARRSGEPDPTAPDESQEPTAAQPTGYRINADGETVRADGLVLDCVADAWVDPETGEVAA